MGSTDAPLREILAEDVPLFLAMTFRTVADRSEGGFETAEFVAVAEGLAAEEGINLPRVVNEHPDLVSEYLGETVSFPERTVEEFDRIADEHYEPTDAATPDPDAPESDGTDDPERDDETRDA